MIKNQIIFYLLIVAIFNSSLVLNSCSKTEDSTNNAITPAFTPKNLVGKEIICYTSDDRIAMDAYDFTVADKLWSDCKILKTLIVWPYTTTPTYDYYVGSNENSLLKIQFTTKAVIGSYYYSTWSYYVFELTFTSESGGTFTGFERSTTTGNVNGINGSDERDLSGKFILKSK